MSADQQPTPATGPDDDKGHGKRGWIIATCVLAAAAVGLGIWAFSLNSSNSDKDDQIAAQQKQIEEAKGVGGQVKEAVSSASAGVQQAIKDMGAQLDQIEGQTQETQDQAQKAIDDAEQAAKQASNEADKAKAQADETKACADGYLSAIKGAFGASSFSDGVEQAKADIQSLNQSCAGSL